jgi:YggT family protein
MEALGSSTAFIVNTLGGLYLLAVLLRFLLQVAKADFYNPVSQSVFKITDPLVRIFQKIIPGYRGIDFSCIILALVLMGSLSVPYIKSMKSTCFVISSVMSPKT